MDLRECVIMMAAAHLTSAGHLIAHVAANHMLLFTSRSVCASGAKQLVLSVCCLSIMGLSRDLQG